MSAYITLQTPMTDEGCLLLALADLGFTDDKVEVHKESVALEGYMGRKRPQRVHILIRRAFIGPSSNDVGFELTSTGYRAHISSYDRSRLGGWWLSSLRTSYNKHYAAKKARLAAARRQEAEERQRALEEQQRMEEARRALVAAQRETIRAKAKKMGYRVKETKVGKKLRLVLVKRTY